MKITLNGETKELSGPMTVQQLLDSLQIQTGRVACEVNLKIVKRAFYAGTPLKEGDTVEVIQAIGGG
ncbi:MAG: sulfur carrier protein ThiS [Elusimicrobiota bacterium]|jgi:thiamine biosynthesis protein ThiS